MGGGATHKLRTRTAALKGVYSPAFSPGAWEQLSDQVCSVSKAHSKVHYFRARACDLQLLLQPLGGRQSPLKLSRFQHLYWGFYREGTLQLQSHEM